MSLTQNPAFVQTSSASPIEINHQTKDTVDAEKEIKLNRKLTHIAHRGNLAATLETMGAEKNIPFHISFISLFDLSSRTILWTHKLDLYEYDTGIKLQLDNKGNVTLRHTGSTGRHIHMFNREGKTISDLYYEHDFKVSYTVHIVDDHIFYLPKIKTSSKVIFEGELYEEEYEESSNYRKPKEKLPSAKYHLFYGSKSEFRFSSLGLKPFIILYDLHNKKYKSLDLNTLGVDCEQLSLNSAKIHKDKLIVASHYEPCQGDQWEQDKYKNPKIWIIDLITGKKEEREYISPENEFSRPRLHDVNDTYIVFSTFKAIYCIDRMTHETRKLNVTFKGAGLIQDCELEDEVFHLCITDGISSERNTIKSDNYYVFNLTNLDADQQISPFKSENRKYMPFKPMYFLYDSFQSISEGLGLFVRKGADSMPIIHIEHLSQKPKLQFEAIAQTQMIDPTPVPKTEVKDQQSNQITPTPSYVGTRPGHGLRVYIPRHATRPYPRTFINNPPNDNKTPTHQKRPLNKVYSPR